MKEKRPLDYEPVTRTGRALPNDEAWRVNKVESKLELPVGSKAVPKQENRADPSQPSLPVSKASNWLIRRGHFLSFVGVFLFTIAVYLRPYELFTALAPFYTMAFWIAVATLIVYVPTQLGVEGNLTARPREVNLILLLGLAGLLSIPLGDDPSMSFASYGEYLKVILIFVIMVNAMRDERRLRWLIYLLLGISCYVSWVAFSKYSSGSFDYESFRVGGIGGNMFVNPNDMALHLVTMVPLSVGLFLTSRNPIGKTLYLGCAVLMIIGIMVSYSRGGFVGLIAAAGWMLWRIRKNVSGLILGLVLLIPLLALAPSGMGGRFDAILSEGEGGSVSSRREELKRSLLVAARHPLVGVGMGNYRQRSTRNQASHNAYTQIAAEMGFPAMIVYILFMTTSVKRLRKIEAATSAVRRKSRYYYLSVGLQGSLVGYMVCSFFASVAFLWYVYYLVAFSLCLARTFEIKTATNADLRGANGVLRSRAARLLHSADAARPQIAES
jgi:putative inorganic carbon (HCO3(-)) transporter